MCNTVFILRPGGFDRVVIPTAFENTIVVYHYTACLLQSQRLLLYFYNAFYNSVGPERSAQLVRRRGVCTRVRALEWV